MSYPPGYRTKTWKCRACKVPHQMTVYAVGLDDPAVIDRFRLLAASSQWCIDLDGHAWCPEHRELAAC